MRLIYCTMRIHHRMKYQLVFDQLYSKTKRTFCIFISTMGMVRNVICNSIFHIEYKRIATKCPNVPKSDKYHLQP